MGIDDYIYESIFSEKQKHYVFYSLIWEQFKEDGFVIADEAGREVDCIFKAIAIKNLLGEFEYRIYDEVNETGFEDIVNACADIGIGDDEILEYCEAQEEIDCSGDFEATIINALEYISELVADKMLEDYSDNDLFDYMFTVTYDFEQDFTFDFEDSDELLAFVDSNQDRLDQYKEEYESVLDWVSGGMIC
jgi:hypothetical protein